jgi:hypothetical protein
MARRLSRKAKRARVQALVAYYRDQLNLSLWDIKLHFVNTREEMGDDPCAACCEARPEYNEAHLHFALDAITDDDLEPTVIHELSHAIVWPVNQYCDAVIAHYAKGDKLMQRTADLALERVTTDVELLVRRHVPPMPA